MASRRRQSVSMGATMFTASEYDAMNEMMTGDASLVGSTTDRVSVAVRIRPLNSNDIASEATNVLEVTGGLINVLKPGSPEKVIDISFSFDHVYDSSNGVTQKEVFMGVGLPLVLNAALGYNASVFAYGQTGSGKSHTMMGCAKLPGLIPLVSNALFSLLDRRLDEANSSATVEASYIEVYQERVHDLLGEAVASKAFGGKPPAGLRLREDSKTGIFVEGLTAHPVATYADVASLLETGLHRRTVAATNMNLESSRSHSVFTLEIAQRSSTSSDLKKSKISLIDLAGSERVERTGATGQRLKEGQIINKSLLTLGRCISALAKPERKNKDGSAKAPTPVPFRESTLTLLLRESLMGNSRSAIIAAVSPSSSDNLETTSTLRFAATCKDLKTKAKVNEVSVTAEVSKLRAEVEALKAELARATSGGEASPSSGGVLRLNFLQAKIETLSDSSELNAQDIRRVWIAAVAEQQRKRVGTLFAGVSEEDLGAVPYLYNLDQDTQMQGQLPLPLPAKDVRIGRSDSETAQDLEVNGLGIALDHAIISPDASPDGTSTGRALVTLPGAVCYVNGKKTGEGVGVSLAHGDRIVLGSCTMVFLYIDPASLLDVSLIDGLCSYWDALEEIFAGPKSARAGGSFRLTSGSPRMGGPLDSDDGLLGDFSRMAARTLEVQEFQMALTRVQRDVLQANTIGKQIGLTFEAHLCVGPLPVGTEALQSAPKSEVLGMVPSAPMSFRVQATFEHTDAARTPSQHGSTASFDASGPVACDSVVLMDCPSNEFAEISMRMISAYGDVATVARGLLQASGGHASASSPGLIKKATSFYGHVFRGLDVDGSGSISYAELKEGARKMEIDISEVEMAAHFTACGSEELDEASLKRLLSRHLKLKLGAILQAVYDPDAFALFLRDDLESTAHSSGHATGAVAAGRLAVSLAGDGPPSAIKGQQAEARAAVLEEAVLVANREVERIIAKRQALAARMAALASGQSLTAPDATSTGAASTIAASAEAVAAKEPVDGDALHAGWLRRKATSIPYNWTKLWFVLKASALMIYDRPNGQLKECLDLSAGVVVSPDGTGNRFAITASVRKEVSVEAASQAELDDWLTKLMAESGRQIRRRTVADAAEGSGR